MIKWPSFRNGVQNFKEQISEIPHGINNHNEHRLLTTRSTKTVFEIEENIIKDAKLYFPKLALGEANFVDRCPRFSNTAYKLMYTRTGRRRGVYPEASSLMRELAERSLIGTYLYS